MPVSSSIYSNIGQGVTPLEDPQNALLRALKMQGAQEEMQAQRMTRARTEEDYRRGLERSNRLQQLASGDYADDEARADAFIRGGFIDEGQKILKGRADYLKTRADARKTDVEILDKSLGVAKSFVPGIRSREAAAAYLEGLYSDPVLGPIAARLSPKEMALQNIPTDPQQLERWKAGHMSMTADKLMELSLPKLLTSDVGNAKVTTGYDQFTGKPIAGTGQRQEVFQSPDNAASNLTSVENNKRTVAAAYANATAGREQALATRDAAKIAADSKRAQDAEMKLSDDYRVESKGWAETATAIGMVKEALKTADKNPGSALAAGTKFMKLLDPTSVVRETELGMALNASGWFDRATNVANQLQSGRVMTKEQVKNLGAAGDALYEEARKAQLQIDAAFEARAKAYGANPANVITDRGQRSSRIPAPAANGWSATKVN